MTELAMLSAAEAAAGYAARRFSPVEVARAALARIARFDGHLNAMSAVHEASALAAARASEERWSRGAPLSPLDGVTCTVKDLLLQAGVPAPRGSRATDAAAIPDQDAPAVARLREAGVVFIGRTTTPEFGWKGVTDSPLTGITRNPWDPARTPGGSSGGAAVAAAAGYATLNIGSDGGGSIRIPAGFTGIFGLKPSYGLVPAWPPSPFQPLSHIGPMTRTVADAAAMLAAIARPDDRDWTAPPYLRADLLRSLGEAAGRGVAGLTIAFAPTIDGQAVDGEIAARVDAAAATFAALGARVERAEPPLDGLREVFRLHWYAYAAALVATIPAERHDRLDPGLRRIAAEGAAIPLAEHLRATGARRALGTRMQAFHRRFDLLLTPTLPIPAFTAGREAPEGQATPDWIDWTPFSYPFNLTMQPAASVPCGFTAAGLPCGLQIVGRIGEDHLVLAAARAFERAHPWPMPDLDATLAE